MSYQKGQPVIFNSSMKWQVNDDNLPCTALHSALYMRQENNIETLLGESSFTIGEVYIYQPLTTWLNLRDSDKVKIINMLSNLEKKVFLILSNRYVGIEVK